jgi:hypothetical protein
MSLEAISKLVNELREEAIPHNKANTPVNEGFASGLVHAADRLAAALAAEGQGTPDYDDTDVEVLKRRIRTLEGNLKDINLLYIKALGRHAAALAAGGQGDGVSPSDKARKLVAELVEVSDKYHNGTHAKSWQIWAINEIANALAPAEWKPAKVREAVEASWNAGFPFVPGITDEQIQFITDRLNGEKP